MRIKNLTLKTNQPLCVVLLWLAVSFGIVTAQTAPMTVPQTSDSSSKITTSSAVPSSTNTAAAGQLFVGTDGFRVAGTSNIISSYFAVRGVSASSPVGGQAPPVVIKSFGATSVPPGGVTILRLDFINANLSPINPLLSDIFLLGITDFLPAGMVVFTQPNVSNTCYGTLVALPNTNFVQLTNGYLPSASSCSVTVLVQVTGPGPKINITDPVTAANTGAGNAATASMTVTCPATFTVDNLSDSLDPSPGDGICGTNYLGMVGGCSLRAAVQ